jgi:hypothetical protein
MIRLYKKKCIKNLICYLHLFLKKKHFLYKKIKDDTSAVSWCHEN